MIIFYVIVSGIIDYNNHVDSVRAIHHVRLLPNRTSRKNRCQDSDYR